MGNIHRGVGRNEYAFLGMYRLQTCRNPLHRTLPFQFHSQHQVLLDIRPVIAPVRREIDVEQHAREQRRPFDGERVPRDRADRRGDRGRSIREEEEPDGIGDTTRVSLNSEPMISVKSR